MPIHNLKVRTCAILAALLLAAAALPAAAAPATTEGETASPWYQLLVDGWSRIVDAATGGGQDDGEQGPTMDPNGIALSDSADPDGEQGPTMDPNGNHLSGGAAVDPSDG